MTTVSSAQRRKGARAQKLRALPVEYHEGIAKSLHAKSPVAHAFLKLHDAVIADLGGDPSTAQRMLIERLCWLSMRCATVELAFAQGKDTSDTAYAALVNTLSAVAAKLGLQRTAKPIADLHTYMREAGGTSSP